MGSVGYLYMWHWQNAVYNSAKMSSNPAKTGDQGRGMEMINRLQRWLSLKDLGAQSIYCNKKKAGLL